MPESLFNSVAGLRPATLLKKRLWHRCFPVNFAKFLRAPFFQNTSGRLFLDRKKLPINNQQRSVTTPKFDTILFEKDFYTPRKHLPVQNNDRKLENGVFSVNFEHISHLLLVFLLLTLSR